MFFSMLKRDGVLFVRCLLSALLLTLVFGLVCAGAAVSALRGAEDVFVPVKAAVVDGEDTVASRLLINAVSGTDYISDVLEIEKYSMRKAEKALKAGEIAAIIVLPENFIGDITGGKMSRGQIILSPASVSNSDVVSSTARFGEVMLAAGQYAAIGGDILAMEKGLDYTLRRDCLAEVNSTLLNEAMSARDTYFDITVTDYAGTSMSTDAHYAVSWISFLLFLCALFFAKLCRSDFSRPMLCRLRASGVRDGAFLLGKIGYPFLFRAILLLLLLPWASQILTPDPLAVIGGVAAVLLASVIGTAITLATESGTAVNAFLAIAGLFLCGGILPRQILPDILLWIGEYSPFGVVRSLLSPLFGGRISPVIAVLSIVYALAAVLWCLRSLENERIGGDA